MKKRKIIIISAILALALTSGIVFYSASLHSNLFSFFNAEEEEREKEEEEKGEAIKAFDLWSEMRTYPHNNLEAPGFTESFEKSLKMGFTDRMNSLGMNSVTTAPWAALAPMNFAGRILSIAFHPTDANTMWVGSASGGLWKTTTGGTGGPGGISWQYVPTGFPVLGISSIVVNPSDPNEIYIGTGEVYNPSAAAGGATGAGHTRTFRGSYGIGILKTTNGGTTWTKTLDFSNSSIKGVMDMLIHPTTPSTVFAATTDGVYRTTNSGGTWTLIHNVTMAMDMVFKPGNPDVIYVGCGNFQSAGTGIYKTTNANALTPSFTQLTSASLPSPISGKIMLAISANNPNRVYASIGKDPNTSHTQGLYVSTNEGSTWAAAGTPNMLNSQGWYSHDVAVSPTNASRLLWGELDTYLSTDGGATKTQTGFWSEWDVNNTTVGDLTEGQSDANPTDYVHADVHRIEASPHDVTGNTFFLCTDGGLFRTTDGGNNFNTLNGGLNTAQIYAKMSVHPTNPNYMLCGLQDNEAMVYEGNTGCRRIGNLGDGFHATMNSTGTIQIVESYYFNRRRSTNSGASFGAGSGAVAELACFNVPMVYSKTSGSGYVFAGSIYFKRSADNGATWSNLNGGVAIAGANNPIIAMEAPSNSVVYFSTAPGSGVRSKLWKTTNATAGSPTFTEITGTLPDRYYSAISVDPTNVNRLAVTLSGFGTSHVYLSNDGGTTWSSLNGSGWSGLPDIPHNAVMFDPNTPTNLYVGNDQGVYFAANVPTGALGATTPIAWYNYSEGLSDAAMVTDIAVTNTNKLRLATYGRGIWERDMTSLSTFPVKFKSFDVTPKEKSNELKWVISSQENVDRYEIEYSTDAVSFTKAGTVNARNIAGELTYTYTHNSRKDITVYYRIKAADRDGTHMYSETKEVKAQKKQLQVVLYPNPTTGVFKVRTVYNGASENMNIKVFNNSGQLVYLTKVLVQQSQQEFAVDISRLPAGTYRVICEQNETKWTNNILKK
jgi:hypothetical protein